jgi:hypothetical protein
MDNISKIKKDNPQWHIDELYTLSEEAIRLCDEVDPRLYADVDGDIGEYASAYIDHIKNYLQYMKQCGSISIYVRNQMKRPEDLDIALACIGLGLDDKQITDIMMLNLEQSQIDSDSIDRLVKFMNENPCKSVRDAFEITEGRMIKLKNTIHEKLHPRNKPYLHTEELQELFGEAVWLCNGNAFIASHVLGLSVEEGWVLDTYEKLSQKVKNAITSWKDLENVVCRSDIDRTSDEEKIDIMIRSRGDVCYSEKVRGEMSSNKTPYSSAWVNNGYSIQLTKTCISCAESKKLDEFDSVQQTVEIILKPDLIDWLKIFAIRKIEGFQHLLKSLSHDEYKDKKSQVWHSRR